MTEIIKKALNNYINEGKESFVIFPFGKYGREVKKILNNDFNIQELFVVDNNLSKQDSNIYDIEYLRTRYEKEDFYILLAIDPIVWNNSLSIHRQLMEFASLTRVLDVLSWSPYFTPWNHYEPINFMNRHKIAIIECMAREIYKNNIDGAIAEAGVFQGQTARFMNYLFPDRKLYLFDTFEGFNIQDQNHDDERNMYNLKIDYTGTTEKIVLEKMHYPKQCIIKKGWFPESATNVNEKFSLVRLDMDLYDPIYAGLEFFYPKMQKGGYIIIHDCRSRNFDGARQALIDFCKKNHIGYMCMHDNLGSAVINIGL